MFEMHTVFKWLSFTVCHQVWLFSIRRYVTCRHGNPAPSGVYLNLSFSSHYPVGVCMVSGFSLWRVCVCEQVCVGDGVFVCVGEIAFTIVNFLQ